jgi:nitroreductase
MDTLLAVASKREVRAYSDRPLTDDAVRRILEAGRIAGSSQNRQRRSFLVLSNPELRAQLAEGVYAPGNVRGAALVVVVVAQGGGPVAFDVGRAAQNMMLAAWNDGIGSCPNGIPDPDAVGHLLGLDEDERPAIVLTFGYPARERDPNSRSAEEWIAHADRKPFDEVVRRL